MRYNLCKDNVFTLVSQKKSPKISTFFHSVYRVGQWGRTGQRVTRRSRRVVEL